jgi:uncharacterized protein YjbI with pentapeptide repeats
MATKLREVHSVKFSQQTLATKLQAIVFAQRPIFNLILIAIAICFAVLAGCCTAILYIFISRTILFYEGDVGLWLAVGNLITLLIWLNEIFRSSLVTAFWKASFAGFITTLLILIYFHNPRIIFLYFFILFTLVVTLISLLSSCLSFQLCNVLIPQKNIQLKIISSIALIATSIITASSWSSLIEGINESFDFIVDYYSFINAIGGLGVGVIMIFVTQRVLNFVGDRAYKFEFLRQWAIVLASWGGTSFYRLDLSRIDFTRSKVARTDFRASKFYRTCLRDVKGLDRARVDGRYFDLDSPKVQELLTNGSSREHDFNRVNLRGAYLQDADLRQLNLSEANLDGADLSGADLRDSILVRSILTSADLSRANLTGVCIQDWSVNSETDFSSIQCDYIYREYRDNRPTDRYPSDRDFEPGEFEALFQKLTNAVELVFRDQIDWRALSFTFEKFRLEDDGMGLELKGIEQRGDYWIVKVTHGEGVSKQQVERQVQSTYDELRAIMEVKDKQINRLLGIVEHQTEAMQQQAVALTHFSKHPFGNNFFISGSTITNLAGSGQIEYREAADRIRNLLTNRVDPHPTLQRLISQLNDQNVATTSATRRELIQQVLLSEAEQDPSFKQFLLQQGQQIISSLPSEDITIAVQAAIAQLGA